MTSENEAARQPRPSPGTGGSGGEGVRGWISREGGLGLAELLVVMTLLTVVGGIVLSSVVSGMNTSRESQDRVQAFAELQRAVERMSREVRAADPLVVAEPDHLEASVRRGDDDEMRCYTARVDGGDLVEGWDGAERSVVSGLEALDTQPVFTYFDYDGDTMEDDFDPDDVTRVGITVVRTLPAQPSVQVETMITIRNVPDELATEGDPDPCAG
jgi:hypothetical protein